MSSSSKLAYASARRLLLAMLAAGVLIIAGADAAPDPKELAETARQRASTTTPTTATPTVTAADLERAKALAETGLQRGRTALQALMDQQRRAAGNATQLNESEEDARTSATSTEKKPILPGRVVVALSSSMPETVLREYMRQLDGIPEGIVVLRGFIGGARTVAPTGVWIEKLRRIDVECLRCPHRSVEVVVDPLAYRMLGIRQVPAVIYLPGVQDLRHCDAEELQAAQVVYGAVSIGSALQRLLDDGVAVPPALIKQFGGRT